MTGEMSETSAVPGSVHDLVATECAERLTSSWSFEDDEHSGDAGVGSLSGQSPRLPRETLCRRENGGRAARIFGPGTRKG